MDVIGLMAAELNLIGRLIYNVLYSWVSQWGGNSALFGAFSITVIIFTLFLKVATSPFDVWQKRITRKNQKIMEVMKPELDKVTKQCGANREMLMQKQRAVYKKYKYSTFASCLPMIITLAIFITVFSGFNSAVRYHNYETFQNLSGVYSQTYNEKMDELIDEGKATIDNEGRLTAAEGYTETELRREMREQAEEAVVEVYQPESFLLTTNVFMPDTWAKPIPTVDVFSSTGIGKLGITGVDRNEYERVMKPLMEKYNQTEDGKRVWNGYLMLPLLAFVLNLLGSKLNKPPEQPQMAGQTEEQKKAQQSQTKMLTYMMPVMMAVFAFLYSTAFALYMFMNSTITTLFNLIYNIVAKRKDEKEKEHRLATTVKR